MTGGPTPKTRRQRLYRQSFLFMEKVDEVHNSNYLVTIGHAMAYLEIFGGCSLLDFATLSLCMKLLISQIQNQLGEKGKQT